jgi:hypothetical protein
MLVRDKSSSAHKSAHFAIADFGAAIRLNSVTPAKAGAQTSAFLKKNLEPASMVDWVPAFAGITLRGRRMAFDRYQTVRML